MNNDRKSSLKILNNNPISILGAGSWGTALAIHLARNKQQVRLWSPEVNQIDEIRKTNINSRYLPNIILPNNIELCYELSNALNNAQDVLIVTPSHAFRSTVIAIRPLISRYTRLAWATKGLDATTHQLLHNVIEEILGKRTIAVLSGPSFAKEVALNLPTAVTIASSSHTFTQDLYQRFNTTRFRIHTSQDIIGVELGGAMKNIIAIAVGIADGLGFGMNAKATLITLGLAEMVRLGLALGGKRKTFMGLSGIGDLVLTCTDNQSRNRRFGVALGQGQSLETAKRAINQVIEGINTTAEIYKLSQQKQIEIPICEKIYRILFENLSAKVAGEDLL